jgi:hypothetical protein
MGLRDLKAACRDLNLPTGGTKADLTARLMAALSSNAEEQEQERDASTSDCISETKTTSYDDGGTTSDGVELDSNLPEKFSADAEGTDVELILVGEGHPMQNKAPEISDKQAPLTPDFRLGKADLLSEATPPASERHGLSSLANGASLTPTIFDDAFFGDSDDVNLGSGLGDSVDLGGMEEAAFDGCPAFEEAIAQDAQEHEEGQEGELQLAESGARTPSAVSEDPQLPKDPPSPLAAIFSGFRRLSQNVSEIFASGQEKHRHSADPAGAEDSQVKIATPCEKGVEEISESGYCRSNQPFIAEGIANIGLPLPSSICSSARDTEKQGGGEEAQEELQQQPHHVEISGAALRHALVEAIDRFRPLIYSKDRATAAKEQAAVNSSSELRALRCRAQAFLSSVKEEVGKPKSRMRSRPPAVKLPEEDARPVPSASRGRHRRAVTSHIDVKSPPGNGVPRHLSALATPSRRASRSAPPKTDFISRARKPRGAVTPRGKVASPTASDSSSLSWSVRSNNRGMIQRETPVRERPVTASRAPAGGLKRSQTAGQNLTGGGSTKVLDRAGGGTQRQLPQHLPPSQQQQQRRKQEKRDTGKPAAASQSPRRRSSLPTPPRSPHSKERRQSTSPKSGDRLANTKNGADASHTHGGRRSSISASPTKIPTFDTPTAVSTVNPFAHITNKRRSSFSSPLLGTWTGGGLCRAVAASESRSAVSRSLGQTVRSLGESYDAPPAVAMENAADSSFKVDKVPRKSSDVLAQNSLETLPRPPSLGKVNSRNASPPEVPGIEHAGSPAGTEADASTPSKSANGGSGPVSLSRTNSMRSTSSAGSAHPFAHITNSRNL